jgi:hypothetical protein
VAEHLGYGSGFLMLAGFSATVAALVLWLLKETAMLGLPESEPVAARG